MKINPYNFPKRDWKYFGKIKMQFMLMHIHTMKGFKFSGWKLKVKVSNSVDTLQKKFPKAQRPYS